MTSINETTEITTMSSNMKEDEADNDDKVQTLVVVENDF